MVENGIWEVTDAVNASASVALLAFVIVVNLILLVVENEELSFLGSGSCFHFDDFVGV